MSRILIAGEEAKNTFFLENAILGRISKVFSTYSSSRIFGMHTSPMPLTSCLLFESSCWIPILQ